MERHITPINPSTYLEAAQALGRAFTDESVSKAVFSGLSPDERTRYLTAWFAAELPIRMRWCCLPAIQEDGKICAAAAINSPGTYPLPLHEEVRIVLRTICGAGLYGLDRWFRFANGVEKFHPKEPHYYLEFIGVEPAWQGRGLGSAILHHLAQRADDDQVGCYLETADSRNVPLYQHLHALPSWPRSKYLRRLQANPLQMFALNHEAKNC